MIETLKTDREKYQFMKTFVDELKQRQQDNPKKILDIRIARDELRRIQEAIARCLPEEKIETITQVTEQMAGCQGTCFEFLATIPSIYCVCGDQGLFIPLPTQ